MTRSERILEILQAYVATPTNTGTSMERNAENFFKSWFDSVPYLKDHPDQRGLYPVKDDHLDRHIAWALYKGGGDRTVVLIHHTDVVDADDFGAYKDQAFDIPAITKLFEEGKFEVKPEVQKDIDQGGWLFGRGASDMKSGASIHLALFEDYAEKGDLHGNILVLGVPDEENSSAGMRSAAYLLKELKEKFGLDYIFMINGEPHDRIDPSEATIYDGSIGKLMPIFLVRGKLAHVGQIYQGLSPILLLSEIVSLTDLNPDFIEKEGNTLTPPPTWLYFKDRKQVYDVSLPLTAGGYMSILPLARSPKEIMDSLKDLAHEAFENVIDQVQASYKVYRGMADTGLADLDLSPRVMTYDEVYELLMKENPGAENDLQAFEEDLVRGIHAKELDRVEACYRLMERALSLLKDKDPVVVIGLAPPYYPAVNNKFLKTYDQAQDLVEEIKAYSKKTHNQGVYVQNYFTGICDLSYAMYTASDEEIDYIKGNMLLWGTDYEIPLDLIRDMSMPVLNIGAWGKDLHMYTERINVEDLTVRIPDVLDQALRTILG